jgi:putative redox protein
MREITLNWNPESPMLLEATDPNGIKVSMDSSPEFGGQGRGVSPKLMLMLALGGCTGMDVLSLLRKMRQDVTAYHMEIKGWEQTEHPQKFDRIIVEHVITGRNLNQAMVDKAISLSHHKYCGVSASLAGSVEIEMTGRLVEVEEVEGV